jgi:phosphoribosylanthranilate isomerase
MPSGPGPIAEALIADIASRIPPGVATFLLTCKQEVEAIIDQQRRLRVNTIQICDRIEAGSHEKLRNALPGVSLVQVIHVTGHEAVAEAISVDRVVDAILLDSGNQTLPVKELGGTGRTHDWSVSRKIRESVSIPIFLAGGLRSDNVGQAIDAVRPFGVDVCSGVRTNGQLDEAKLSAFFAHVQRHH